MLNRLNLQNLILTLFILTLSACSSKSNDSVVDTKQASQIQNVSTKSIPSQDDKAIPKYDHIFVIIEENKAYNQIIGSSNAPTINKLAQTYGAATNFYAEVHPSEANYIAMLGGDTFGIHDDDAFFCEPNSTKQFCKRSVKPGYVDHTVKAKSLMEQLESKGLTWKGYFEDIPSPGSKEIVSTGKIPWLYAVKHNGFLNFKNVQDDPNIKQKIVGFDQLAADLSSENLPNYSHIVPNQCNEMHGLAECRGTDKLIQTGDAVIGKLVNQITSSKIWKSAGNNAIVITWDEDDGSDRNKVQGCCSGFDPNSKANFGGGHIATVVITNHGAKGVVDNTHYNHYSLLRTTEDAFGIYEYLGYANDTSNGVKPMTRLFAK